MGTAVASLASAPIATVAIEFGAKDPFQQFEPEPRGLEVMCGGGGPSSAYAF